MAVQPSQDSSVGLAQKEQAPVVSATVASEVSSIIRESETKHNIPQEVRDAGLEEVREKFDLAHQQIETGVESPRESKPVVRPEVPMEELEALEIIRTTKKSDSRHWLAVLVEKIFKQFRMEQSKSIKK